MLAHARAILTNTTSGGVTAYVDCDVHDPETILAEARDTLDFAEPIAVMFMGMLGHVQDVAKMQSIVARVVEAVPPGSYLALWDSTNTSEAYVNVSDYYTTTGAVPYLLRSPEQIGQCFDGLDLVDPGLVPITKWRPEVGTGTPIDGYGAVGGKP